MPARADNRNHVLGLLGAICRAFPGAAEIGEGSVGDPVYKVGGKIFAMQHGVGERMSLWCKAPPGVQGALVGAKPDRIFVPPYVGHRGWIGVWLDGDPDWDEIADLIDESYRMTAPKRLLKELDDAERDRP
ncbi:MAG: MmcQ/YjbR family DNA-binding protein [Chloroflexia bacterium]|jgi:predicted DNA-binding protein (MmcQ/YjbR family)|nr:MmcQ/YjbR family DNA-binding protein [Chloroflexia bacterium]